MTNVSRPAANRACFASMSGKERAGRTRAASLRHSTALVPAAMALAAAGLLAMPGAALAQDAGGAGGGLQRGDASGGASSATGAGADGANGRNVSGLLSGAGGGGAGETGGAGGAGLVLNVASIPGGAGGASPGANGADGTAASFGGQSGSGGGGGAHGAVRVAAGGGGIGGAGGAGGSGPSGGGAAGGGGGGGAGGWGVVANGAITITLGAGDVATGGAGGAGGNGGNGSGSGGGGGAGGLGAAFNVGGGTLTNAGTITGGAGGAGGSAAVFGTFAKEGGVGGAGGAGVRAITGTTTITNSGTITGGSGGAGGAGAESNGAAGAGGVGLVGSGITLSNTGTIAGGLAGGGGARAFALDLSGTNSITNVGTLTGGINIASGTTTFNIATTNTLANVISGAGVLEKTNSGTLILTGANTYSGGTVITLGRLTVDNDGNLGAPSGGITFNGGTLQINGTTSSTRSIQMDGAGLIEVAANQTVTLEGAISGSGGFFKSGFGTLVLTGSNNSTGSTTISRGTLQIGNGGTTGTLASGGVSGGGILAFNRSDNITVANAISGLTNITKQGAGTLTLTALTSGGQLRIEAGTLVLSGASAPTGGGVLRMEGGNLTLGVGANFFQVLHNSGVVDLGGNDIALQNGAYDLNGGSITGGGRISLAPRGGTFRIASASATVGPFVTIAGGTAPFGDTVELNIAGNYALPSTLTGTFLRVAITNPGFITTFSGSNSYGGATNVNSGTLVVASDTALGTGMVNLQPNTVLASGGTGDRALANAITLNGTGITISNPNVGTNFTLSGVVSGLSGFTKTGAGTLTLTGTNDYTGLTSVSAGTLVAAANSALGTAAGATSVADGATLALGGGITIADALNLAGNGMNGSGALQNLSGANRVTGAITLASAVRIGGVSGSLLLDGVINANDFDLTINGDANVTLGSTVNLGLGRLVVATPGSTVALRDTLAQVSEVSIETGTLQLGTNLSTGDNRALSDTALVRLNGGNLSVLRSETIGSIIGGPGTSIFSTAGATLTLGDPRGVFGGTIDGALSLIKQGNETLTLTGANTYRNTTTISGGTLQIGNGGTTGSIESTSVINNGTLRFNRSDALTYSGVISGSGALIKQGGGNLTLSGRNSYDGLTTVSGGTLTITTAIGLGTPVGATVVQDGASLVMQGTLFVDEAITISGSGVGGTGALRSVGVANVSGLLTLAAPSTIAAGAGGGLILDAVTGTNVWLTTAGAGDVRISGALSLGTGDLLLTGTGTVSLFGNNSFTGRVSINSGTLVVSGGSAINDTSLVSLSPGANFNVFTSETVGSLEGSGVINIGDGQRLTANYSSNRTFAGLMAPLGRTPADFTKAGNATLTLTGTIQSAVSTTISGGTLQVGDGRTFGSLNSNVITNNAELVFNRSDNITVSGAIGGSGSLVKRGAGVLTLTGANTYGSFTDIQQGTLVLGQVSGGVIQAAGTGGFRLGNNTLLQSNVTGTLANSLATFRGNSATIGAAAGTTLTLTGTSISIDGGSGTTLTFGTSSLTGRIRLDIGAPFVSSGGAMAIAGGAVELSSGVAGTLFTQALGGTTIGTGSTDATLDVNANAVSLFNLTGSSAGLLTNTGSTFSRVSLRSSSSTTFAGAITGALNIEKLESGTLTLTGNNTYTGTTSVVRGTLQIGNGGTTGTLGSGAVTVETQGNLTFNRSDDLTVDNLIGGSGSVTKAGQGILTLTGANTYAGGTTITGGTLLVNGTLGSGVTVNAGTTLGGAGRIGGSVNVAGGGRLAPGQSPGTLAIVGDLTLSDTSILDFELAQAGVVGGGINDLITVGGNLTLDGVLNVTALSGFGSGYYRLFNHGGLTNNGLTIGVLPNGFSATLLTNITGQVNVRLDNGSGPIIQYWDGSDTTGARATVNGDGGTGSWVTGATNWTSPTGFGVNSAWGGQIGVFGGAAGGTVSVSGTQSFQELRFETNGYILSPVGPGSGLATTGGFSIINVDAPNITAQINAPISGTGGLTKTGTGRLILAGSNTYAGLTTVSDGALELASGSIAGAVDNRAIMSSAGTINGLVTNANGATFVSTGTLNSGLTNNRGGIAFLSGLVNGAVSNGGSITLTGDTNIGTLTQAATGLFNAGSGTTTIGSIAGSGTISLGGGAFNIGANNANMQFDGAMVGTGIVNKSGTGSLTLSGANAVALVNFGGDLTLQTGATLIQVELRGGSFRNQGTVQGAVFNSATLNSTGRIGTTLTNFASGSANLSGSIGGNISNQGRLVVAGNLVGGGSLANTGMGTVVVNSGTVWTAVNGITNSSAAANGIVINGTVTVNTNQILRLDPRSSILVGATGTLNLSSTTLNAHILSFSGSTFTNAGTVNGRFAASGTVVNNGIWNGSMGLGPSGNLTNNGTWNSDAVANMSVRGQATNNGTYNGRIFSISGPAGQFFNNGTVNVTEVGGISTVNDQATLFNNGVWNGSIAVAPVSAARLSNGGTINGSVTVGVDGDLISSGTINGALTNAGAANIDGVVNGGITNTGRLLVDGGEDLTSVGNVSNEGTGVLIVEQDATWDLTGSFSNTSTSTEGLTIDGTLELSGTLSNGAGAFVTVSDGGTLNAGAVTNAAGGTITVAQGGTVNDALTNSGVVNNAGTYNADVANSGAAAVITNAATGEWTGDVTANDTGASLFNLGRWIGDASSAAVLNNSGTWTGDITNLAGGSLTSTGTITGDLANASGGTASLAGTLTGDVINAGAITLTGVLTGVEDFAQDASGSLDLAGFATVLETLSGSGTVNLGAGGLTLGGAAADSRFDGVIAGSGTLTKVGTGLFVLGGANSFTGLTTISAGTLTLTSGGVLAGAVTNAASFGNAGTVNGLVTNNASLVSTGTLAGGLTNAAGATATLAGVVGGPVSNAGTLTVASGSTLASSPITNTASGVIGNAGSLTGDLANAGQVANTGAWTGAVSNAAGAVFDNAATGSTTGAFDNRGTLLSAGTLSGSLTNSGGARLAGTLVGPLVNSGEVLVSGNLTHTGAVTNSRLFTVSTGTFATSGTFTNSGSLVVNSGAIMTLGTGATLRNSGAGALIDVFGTLRGRIDVASGGLIGRTGSLIVGDVLVASGAAFMGGGTVTGTVTVNGTLMPGNSPGTLTINGALALGSGSTTVFEMTNAVSDQIIVNGTASIASGANLVLTGARAITPGRGLTLISATGGLTGSFTIVKDPSVFGFVRQTGGVIELLGTLLVPTGISAQNGAVVNYINDRLLAGTATRAGIDLTVALAGPDGAAVVPVVQRLSPEPYASAASMALENNLMLAKTVRTAAAFGTQAENAGFFTFAQGFVGGRDTRAGLSGTAAARQRSEGFLGGFGYGTASVGLAAFAGRSVVRQEIGALGAETRSEGTFFGARGQLALGGLRVNAAAIFDRSDASTTRAPITGAANGRYALNGETFDGELAYELPVGSGFMLRPSAGVTHARVTRADVNEVGGGAAALSVVRQSYEATWVNGEVALRTGEDKPVRPWIGVGLRHLAGGDPIRATAALAGFGGALTVEGARALRTFAHINGGISADLAPGLTAYISGEIDSGQNNGARQAEGGLRFTF